MYNFLLRAYIIYIIDKMYVFTGIKKYMSGFISTIVLFFILYIQKIKYFT